MCSFKIARSNAWTPPGCGAGGPGVPSAAGGKGSSRQIQVIFLHHPKAPGKGDVLFSMYVLPNDCPLVLPVFKVSSIKLKLAGKANFRKVRVSVSGFTTLVLKKIMNSIAHYLM